MFAGFSDVTQVMVRRAAPICQQVARRAQVAQRNSNGWAHAHVPLYDNIEMSPSDEAHASIGCPSACGAHATAFTMVASTRWGKGRRPEGSEGVNNLVQQQRAGKVADRLVGQASDCLPDASWSKCSFVSSHPMRGRTIQAVEGARQAGSAGSVEWRRVQCSKAGQRLGPRHATHRRRSPSR